MEAEARDMTRAWVLHPDVAGRENPRPPKRQLDEALGLAQALPGLDVVGTTLVPLPKPRPGHLFGSGKTQELKALFADNAVELVLVDGPVTPVQQRNLEKAWNCKLLDRTSLILEIFSDRARTKEGVLQVEMAALAYQRTRLVRAWTHLERQRGALGFVGGPGETQIEADRRAIDDQLIRLRRQLTKVSKTRGLHRASRKKVPFPVVALVGYTNAGKSTLFNRLTGAKVLAKDMLFATLDPTMRAMELPDGTDIILSDTVGFISGLPTQLVAAFRATLEEVLDADLVIHVRDISHPESEAEAEDVKQILGDLGVPQDAAIVEVWNKLDEVPAGERAAVLRKAERSRDVVALSALTGEGLDALAQKIAHQLAPGKQEEVLTLTFGDGRRRAWLFEHTEILAEEPGEDGLQLRVRWSDRTKAAFCAL
ncbi:MAG: GTPase HflX [Pseudomonadota bacterium]